MIKGAVYVLNLEQVKLHGPTNLGWEKITFVQRRLLRTRTFEQKREDLPPETVTCEEYEWVVFTHCDQGYVPINEDEFEDELCYGRYELENWKELHREAA
tara:strand:- start:463 stop:762 length:300 start_codon:yes stop_codon:yes gene_type:complete